MYAPSKKILEKYADLLVNFALNSGRGIKSKDVVFLQVPECAKPLLVALRAAVLKAGGYPITEYLPDDYAREFYQLANDDQLKFFPSKYLQGKVDQMDHVISIIADTDKYELKGIDPKKIMTRGLALEPYKKWRDDKENKGKMTWTLALYATPAMAKEAKMSLKKYWEQIIKGCYLNTPDPIEKWVNLYKELEGVRGRLNNLEIDRLHIKAKDTNLKVNIGKNRKWLGGSGRNIPSFELFISPDWRGTEGYISFNQPLFSYGNVVRGVKLEFKNGLVTKSFAIEGQKVLREMIKTKDADKIGEFSLTDSRFSKITKFMGETLFDENMGGKYGNTHIALGSAYKDSFPGDLSKIKPQQWKAWGYNESSVHTDIVSTTNRTVTATLADGKKLIIYKNGRFAI